MSNKGVTLRALSGDDLPKVRRWGNDPAIVSFLDRVRPISEMEHEQWFEGLAKDQGVYIFVVEDQETKTSIGMLWLCNLDHRHRKGEARILIGEKDFRGKGYGKKAMDALVEFGFKKLNLHKIYAYVLSENVGSKKMFESCGFKVEGTLKDEYYFEGGYIDGYRLGIVRKE